MDDKTKKNHLFHSSSMEISRQNFWDGLGHRHVIFSSEEGLKYLTNDIPFRKWTLAHTPVVDPVHPSSWSRPRVREKPLTDPLASPWPKLPGCQRSRSTPPKPKRPKPSVSLNSRSSEVVDSKCKRFWRPQERSSSDKSPGTTSVPEDPRSYRF